AVKAQIALEHKGAELLAGALEALSLTVFIFNAQGSVCAMTPSAELMLSEGRLLKLKSGSLHCMRPTDTHLLTNAVMQAAGRLATSSKPQSSEIIIHDFKKQPYVLQVLTLPR